MSQYAHMAIVLKDTSKMKDGETFNFPILKYFKEGDDYQSFQLQHPECEIRTYDEYGLGTKVK